MKNSKYMQAAFWKRNFKFVIFHLLNAFFVLVLFFFLSKLKESRIIADAKNEALPGGTTEYFTVTGIERMDFSFLLLLEEMEHTTLLSHRPSTGLKYEVLYTSGKKDIFGGNYFKKQDFTSGKVSMVLGCSLKEDGEEAGAIKTMAASIGKEAVVLGELPPSVNAAWNYSIFYTCGRIGEMDVPPVFALSSSKAEYLKTALEAFSEEISKRGGVLELCDFRQVEYRDFFKENKIDAALFCGVLLLMFLSEWAAVYVIFLWRGSLRTVQFFLGKRRILFWESVKSLLMLVVDALCGSLLVCLIYRTSVFLSLDFLFFSALLVFLIGSLAIAFVAAFYKQSENFLRTKRD